MILNDRIKKVMIENFKDFINKDFKEIYYEIKSYNNNDIEAHLYDKNYFENDFILDLDFKRLTVFKREDNIFFISAEDFEIYVIIK